jgi:hypothetical protein
VPPGAQLRRAVPERGHRQEVSFHNKGLYNLDGQGAYPAESPGVIEITGKASDMGMYRAPTLRNIELTAPYMHDGSVATLGEVIDLYARRRPGCRQDSPLKSPLLRPRHFSAQDRADLIAFLKTLTDHQFIRDPRYSDPFPAAPRSHDPAPPPLALAAACALAPCGPDGAGGPAPRCRRSPSPPRPRWARRTTCPRPRRWMRPPWPGAGWAAATPPPCWTDNPA